MRGTAGKWAKNGPRRLDGLAFGLPIQALGESGYEAAPRLIPLGRIRQLRVARMKKRMMAAVPKASVIITNPTHYSVALQYNRGMSAPVCVAKGVDHLAFKIREIAKQHDIPIVENVPLARALYATVEVDAEIPVEHYHAVAEIIGYVMGLRRTLAGRRL